MAMSLEISEHAIEKLTHDSEEIRLRALNHIESKFIRAQDHQLTILLNSTELCTQLIRWFGCRPLNSCERVLKLLARVLESYGDLIVEKIGVERLRCELCKIQNLFQQIKTESKAFTQIDDILSRYEKSVLVSDDKNFAHIIDKLHIAEDDTKEPVLIFDPQDYEITWSKPTNADYNSLKFMADVLTNKQSTNEELENALEYLQVTMPDFPAEYMLQSPHILVKLLNLLERNVNLNESLKCHVVTALQIFLRTLMQRLCKKRKIDGYSKTQVCDISKSTLTLALPLNSQLKVSKAMQLLMKTFLAQLESEPLSSCTATLKIITIFADILKIINVQHLFIDTQLIVQTHRILTMLKNISNEEEQHFTLARTRQIWLTFILHDMCKINAKRSQLYQYNVLKSLLLDYVLKIHFPKRFTAIKKLIFSSDSKIERSYELLKTYETRIQSAIMLLKEEDHQDAEKILCVAENIIPILDTLQSLKLVKYIFKAILGAIKLYPSNVELKGRTVHILHQLLLLQHIPLKCDIYRSVAMAIKKHFVALMNNENYSDGIQNHSLLSALIFGVPLDMNIVQQIVHDSYENINPVITQSGEDIILLLLRSYHFYGAKWTTFHEILLPALPLIQSYSYSKEISKVLLNILDPDSKHFPFIALLRGNITFLFSDDASVRSEALTRLVYMLHSLPQSSEYLPSVMEINDLLPNDLCIFKVPRDMTHLFAATESYYEIPAMQNLLTLLDTPDTVPCVRKSALMQLDIICNNWDMAALFCEEQAHCLVLRALENSLQKGSSVDYVDSIVPIISILAKLLICDSDFCKELVNIPNVYVLLLRALFHYSQNLKVRQDASVCLFLLIFRNFLVVNQKDNTIETPKILKNLTIPLKCKFASSHTTSHCDFVPTQLTNLFSYELEWKSYLRQVILHAFCGVSTITKKQIDQMSNSLDICPSLLRQQSDVRLFTCTDASFILRNLLRTISNATDQMTFVKATNGLQLQLLVFDLEYGEKQLPIDISNNISSTLGKYLQITPGSTSDLQVFTCALELLHLCVRLSLRPIIRDIINIIRSNMHHGIFAMLKNSELPVNVYVEISAFFSDLLFAYTTTETNEKQSADSIFRCNLFEFLHELTVQYNASRRLQPVRCLLQILKNISKTYLNFPGQMMFEYSKSFLQMSREIRSSTQTGTQLHRDCLLNFLQIFVQLPEEMRAMVSPNMLKHLIGLCGHNDAEVCALAWVCLANIANIEIKDNTCSKGYFQNGADFLTHELSYLPGGFIGSCLSTFLSITEINLVRNLAGNLFVLLLNKVYTFEKAIKLLEMHAFFAFAYTSLETRIINQYLPLNSDLFTICSTDITDNPVEVTSCELVSCYTSICITLLKLNPEFVEELCEKPLLFKLFEVIKLPLIKSNPCHYEMCANICQLCALCSKKNFPFLQRTLSHDERWLLSFFDLLDIPENVTDRSVVSILQLLLVLCREDFVCKIICKKLKTNLPLMQKLFKYALTINKINDPLQRYILSIISFLLIKSQQEYITSSSESPLDFAVLLETKVDISYKSTELCTTELMKKKVAIDDTNKEKFSWNTSAKISNNMENYDTEKFLKTKTDESQEKTLSALIFVDLFHIFNNLYPCNLCKFEFSPSPAKIQTCETLSLLLKLTHHSRLAAKNLKLFDKVLQVLQIFFQKFNSNSTTYVRRYGEHKKTAIMKNFQILFNIILNWYSPGGAILSDEVDSLNLSKVILQTWPWLTHSLELKLLILKICSFVSERSMVVCRQFSVIISSHDHSILQLVTKVVITETHKIRTSNEIHLSIVNTGLRIMMNCSACIEGRFIINKEHVLDVFDGFYAINIKSLRIRNNLLNSWLEFWELFSRYTEGAKSRNLNVLCALINRNPPSTSLRLLALKIIRNMCFLSTNRYQLMASSEFIYMLNHIITQPFSIESNKETSFEEHFIICVSIWQLISGGIKYMAMIRGTKLSGELQIFYEKLSNRLTQNSNQSVQWPFSAEVKNVLDIIFKIFSE